MGEVTYCVEPVNTAVMNSLLKSLCEVRTRRLDVEDKSWFNTRTQMPLPKSVINIAQTTNTHVIPVALKAIGVARGLVLQPPSHHPVTVELVLTTFLTVSVTTSYAMYPFAVATGRIVSLLAVRTVCLVPSTHSTCCSGGRFHASLGVLNPLVEWL